jgi:heterodisulfide reductase subunit A
MCLVEAKKGKRVRLVTACNYPVTDGLEIDTKSERVLQNRKMNLKLLMKRCEEVPVLTELAKELDVIPKFEGDDKCILCGLCVNVCSDLVGANALTFKGHGTDRVVTTPWVENADNCIACGSCAHVCPTGIITVEDIQGRKILHKELKLGPETVIATPTYQSVPNVPIINKDYCIHFQTEGCGICKTVCEKEAIDYDQKETSTEFDVGSIIAATGFKMFDVEQLKQYGYGRLSNVVTSLDFEKLNCASGPTGGRILKEDGTPQKSVAILHCIGSRDVNHREYCSRVCCMYALKYAHLIKEKVNAEVYQMYIDMRCFGKGYEEFYSRLLEEDVRFIRGKAAEVSDFYIYEEEKNMLVIRVEDTLLNQVRRIPVDMVVLCPPIDAREDMDYTAKLLSLCPDKNGFFPEKHPKLAPVSTATDGVFIAGCAQGPKDIPDTVAQASGAAAQALSLLVRGKIEIESATSWIKEESCAGCRICNTLCPYSAITFDEEKKVSVINEALCKGCGTCTVGCPSGAIISKHFTQKQMFAEIEGVSK